MRVISGNNFHAATLAMYRTVISGRLVESRGGLVREARNLAVVMPAVPAITDFVHRDLNLAYARREWLWYLGADPMDDSIAEHAKAWAKLKQPDGSYFSNYGAYIFGTDPQGMSQFRYVLKELHQNPNSRRASIVLLNRDHLFQENVDTVCTYAINFAIVDGALDMTVMMRSNDAVWGFTNDSFCFLQLYEFVFAVLAGVHEGLQRGQYVHMANSLHIYERHFEMVSKILTDPSRIPVKIPTPTPAEVQWLVRSRGARDEDLFDKSESKEGSDDYVTWLTSFD